VIAALAAAAALAGAPTSAAGETVSAAPDAVTITLYREEGLTSRDLQTDPWAAQRGLVMVTETRTVDVPAGAGVIRFRGVADGMIPQTAKVAGLGGSVAEQNYDYDLLTPGALAARSVGETVRLVRTNPATGAVVEERAVIRSAPQGVVLDIDGRIEALDCSGLPEKLVFDRVPEGLADRPTLSVRTRAAEPGRRTIKLSYLATGLAWSADYVARLNPDGRTLDLTGWLTLANSSDTTFGNAPTEVVAGNLSREQVQQIEATRIAREERCWPRPVRWSYGPPPPPPPPPPPAAPMFADAAVEEIVVTGSRVRKSEQAAPTAMAQQSELGDYKLYTLPERTTVAARQVKQVRFLEKRAVPVQRVFVAEMAEEPEAEWAPAAVLLRARNLERTGLGAPLPAGNVVVMEPDSRGGLAYAGENTLQDTPVGLPVEVETGAAATVNVRQTLTAQDRRSSRSGERVRRSYAVDLTNARPTPVRVEVRHPAEPGLKVERESRRHVEKDGRPLWAIDLRPNSRATLTYTVDVEG
jgi:hypothetical protein